VARVAVTKGVTVLEDEYTEDNRTRVYNCVVVSALLKFILVKTKPSKTNFPFPCISANKSYACPKSVLS